jgi:hypothetical protein
VACEGPQPDAQTGGSYRTEQRRATAGPAAILRPTIRLVESAPAAIVGTMRLQHLKRVRSRQRVWPPSWGRRSGAGSAELQAEGLSPRLLLPSP